MSNTILQKLVINSPLGKTLQVLQSRGIVVLDWRDGYITCPGAHLHTTPTGFKDAQVFVNARGAKIKCFHSSCEKMVAAMNGLLGGGMTSQSSQTVGSPVVVPPPVAYDPYVSQFLVNNYPWKQTSIWRSSPRKLDRFVSWKKHWSLLLSLFDPNDVVWIGSEVYHTGNPSYQNNFRTASNWMQKHHAPGTYICPSTFNPGVYSRSNTNVKDRRFLVVESDILSKDEVGSVFKWMMQEGHHLRAVVDTGGKSLHGWFDYPNPALIPQLKDDLTIFGCDPAMFTPSQAVRLPGVRRNSHKVQELIYLAP